MIVWINGAFGSGKTTTAGLLTKRLDEAKLFDPEYVGYMLRPFVESPTGDFQDLPLWRHLVIETMAGLAQQYPHPWVAAMSLTNAAYRAEILGGLRSRGVEVYEFVLAVAEDRLRARIDADEADVKARGWRHDHVSQALTAFAALTDATFVDASLPAEQVAEVVLEQLRR
ncbi:AAA family ATPase [Dactylosporangium sp. CA-233914]|uniref:AAA family ATPase n=1 Tax=Dactylosporangium sp. CA-233914 TaxID=3239934 RepID=UPI003D8A42C8